MLKSTTKFIDQDELFIVEKIASTILFKRRHLLGLGFNPWSFDRPERLGIALAIFKEMNTLSLLNINICELLDFVLEIENVYNNVPYHSFCHALDVLVKTFYVLEDLRMASYLTSYDILALLFCALCHDAGHPGLNNLYQVNAKTNLSRKYPTSTLESYSVDITLGFINKYSLFRNVSGISDSIYVDSNSSQVDIKKALIDEITEAILLTDMSRHFEVVSMCDEVINCLSQKLKFLNSQGIQVTDKPSKHRSELDILKTSSNSDFYSNSKKINLENILVKYNISNLSTFTTLPVEQYATMNEKSSRPRSMARADVLLDSLHRKKLVVIVLHAVDIFNPILPWEMCKKWSSLMMLESLTQGDLEKQQGLQVTPSMDRATYNQARSSIEFGTIVIMPFFTELSNIIPVDDKLIIELTKNLGYWRSMDSYTEVPNIISTIKREKPSLTVTASNYSQQNFAHEKKSVFAAVLDNPIKKLSVAAGTLEISSNNYYKSAYRRYSNDDADNFTREKIGLLFSDRLKIVEMRRKENKESLNPNDIANFTFSDNKTNLTKNYASIQNIKKLKNATNLNRLRRTLSEGSNMTIQQSFLKKSDSLKITKISKELT
ncbi:hypothetical protein BB561_000585 [Smittium simulii]|uniref:PDEase domain-containing protein n=1 Tax=Smittium simulii TaxID=133385 RepID=A0A2T9YYF1_9FUNG|nr:hypothetical protein BB561_000585 [Smittium simulii]